MFQPPASSIREEEPLKNQKNHKEYYIIRSTHFILTLHVRFESDNTISNIILEKI